MGSVAYSVQIWPKDKANVMQAGQGRGDPNQDPYLPPPTGRLKFSWNPFAMCMEICGPALCIKVLKIANYSTLLFLDILLPHMHCYRPPFHLLPTSHQCSPLILFQIKYT